MKRDWEVIRKILLKIEELPANGALHSHQLVIDGIDKDTAAFHMWLLIDAGLVDGRSADTLSSKASFARGLTWKGCEFLDNIKKDSIWKGVKDTLRNKGLELTYDLISTAAKSVVTQVLVGGPS